MKHIQQKLELPYTILICTTILAISLYAWKYIKSRTKNSSLPPGPRSLPIVGNLLSLDPDLHTYFAKLARTYGPIFKLKLGTKLAIVISSPSTARGVLKDHDITFANRDNTVAGRNFSYDGMDIGFGSYGPDWCMLRKVCKLKLLSKTTLDSIYELRRSEVRQMVRYIYGLSQAGTAVSLGEQMLLTTLNVVTNMLWGGSVKGDERAGLAADFRRVISDITELLGLPNVSDFYPCLARFDLQGIEKRMKAAAWQLDRIFESVIDQRSNIDGGSRSDGKDFVQFLLKLKGEEDSEVPLTKTHIKALLMDMVTGGTDTSASAIEFTMAELLNKPEVMKKAQEELDAIVGQGNVFEEHQIHKLPYLQAVMKESLRLHPPVPLAVPHCPSETCTVGGYNVPKGSTVFVNLGAIHRDATIWENPLDFIPERFLKAQYDYTGNNLEYIPFGSGRRMCPGIAMAERMILYLLATLLHSFDWKLPHGQSVNTCERFGITIKLKNPLVVAALPRLNDPTLYE